MEKHIQYLFRALIPSILILSVFFYSCEIDNNIEEDDYEPNDSEELATPVSQYDSIHGYIGENDVDFFQYEVTREYIDFTRVDITNLDNINEIEARIYDEYLDQIAKLIGGKGEDISMKFANSGGMYFIKLKSYNNQVGDYTLTVKDSEANDDFEPDNTLSQGRVIDTYPTNEITGTILTDDAYPETDYECFEILVKQGMRVDFDVIPSSSNIALHLEIYNKNKELIETVDKAQGESITSWYLYHTDSSEISMYLKLSGDVPDEGGDYRISFEENVYQGKKSGSGVGISRK